MVYNRAPITPSEVAPSTASECSPGEQESSYSSSGFSCVLPTNKTKSKRGKKSLSPVVTAKSQKPFSPPMMRKKIETNDMILPDPLSCFSLLAIQSTFPSFIEYV